MNDTNLLELLQDIWEEDGAFIYLRVHYVEQRNIDLIEIQNIIKFGLNQNIFEIYKCTSHNKIHKLEDFKKMQIDDALTIVGNKYAWEQDKVYYKVTFINNEKWLNDLINLNRIPEAFINFML